MIYVKRMILLLVLLNLLVRINAQPVYNPAESPYLDAVSCTPSFTDASACAANPAAYPHLKGFAAAAYLEKKYLINGLNFAAASFAYGKKSGGAGISVKYFGNAAYNEVHGALNYGKDLGDINLGASFNYNAYGVAGFRISFITIGIHSILKLSDKFYTSLQLINPPFTRLGNRTLKQEAEYHLGFYYESSPLVCISIDFQKIENIPLQVNAAMQYRFGRKFYAKAGLFTGGPQPFFGTGWMLKDFEIQFSVCYHPALGSTPGLLFIYEKPGGVSLQ
jgi:hypothetical protein